jgi:hypothetical protein
MRSYRGFFRLDSQSSAIVEQGIGHMVAHFPTFVTRTPPSGSPRSLGQGSTRLKGSTLFPTFVTT